MNIHAALMLSRWDCEALDTGEFDSRGYWTGYSRRQWPWQYVRRGQLLYGFDPRPRPVGRRYVAVLEITRCTRFNYTSRADFANKLMRGLGSRWDPRISDPVHYASVPRGTTRKPAHGMGILLAVRKRVNVDPNIAKFPQLGWFRVTTDDAFWDVTERDTADLYDEGRRALRTHFAAERNSTIRRLAKAYWRNRFKGALPCEVCGFRFDKKYPRDGDDFIELHHEVPIAAGRRRSSVIALRPVCSNCHRMIHRDPTRPVAIEDLRERLRS